MRELDLELHGPPPLPASDSEDDEGELFEGDSEAVGAASPPAPIAKPGLGKGEHEMGDELEILEVRGDGMS